MPLAKIYVKQGVFDDIRIDHISSAIQCALIEVLQIPTDDFFQLIHEMPARHFRHSPSFLGMRYSDELIMLEITFLAGRSAELRKALLKALNRHIVERVKISQDDLFVLLYETAGENVSFGRGEAQRAFASATK
ncbi:tautomerase family protein [Paraburkholderia dipogonis]|uniref:Tautomerase family protein n=1 Tax=Paraburkholderia dipogonis TaxID=1211383 RepID=A0A4Y8MX50_9BURK|nr:tautomerase family protein [Paraburkholderia dipogonis]TFE41928.1 tautomerase family protein [Paraburkholderia dipogonis]